MFGQDTRTDSRARSTGSKAAFAPFPAQPSDSKSAPAALTPERATSILGPDIRIFGEQLLLKTKGSLLIQGSIQGNVHGDTVTVDDDANVQGSITAHTIEVRGTVSGALKGSSIHLYAQSKVDASILHQKLSIDEGAFFEGAVTRAKDAGEVAPDLS